MPTYDIRMESYNKDTAKTDIARSLKDGCLILILGAGVSQNLGLPLWWELVKKCLDALSLKSSDVTPDMTGKSLTRKAGQIERKFGLDKLNYLEFVRQQLYPTGFEYGDNAIKNKLLISLGALIMGSKRGSIKQVITFNYDDALEWYLQLHGFYTQVITSLPLLHQDPDVTVYHPHGFLPLSVPQNTSDFLIFSKYSFEIRQAAPYNYWTEMTRSLLLEKVALLVGLSGEDDNLSSLLSSVHEVVGGSRPIGFFISGSMMTDEDIEELQFKGVVPVCLDSYEEIPVFLLEVCQKAAELTFA